jgi:hypothetical protein
MTTEVLDIRQLVLVLSINNKKQQSSSNTSVII